MVLVHSHSKHLDVHKVGGRGNHTNGFVSLLLVLVVLLEQQRPPDADLPPGRPAVGVIPRDRVCILSKHYF